MRSAVHRPRGGARGGVYVEFLIAFLPVLILFLCLWQVSILYTTKLFVDHAAFSGARAAAVIIAENPNRVDDGGGPASVNVLTGRRNRLVQDAVGLALMPLILDGTVVFYNVQYPDPAKPGGPNVMLEQKYPGMTPTSVSMARVRVRAMMNCKIAFANTIMCNGLISRIAGALGAGPIFPPYLYVLSEAVFPYQGASYTYDPNDDGSQNGQASGATGSPLASNNISGCFAAGTPVETVAGARPIEQIAPNDVVLSRDEQTGQLAYERVVAVSVTPDRPLVDVRLAEAATIRATPNHLFWTAERQWVPAGELTPGETLFSARLEELHVAGVEPEAEHETVYNFEVERTHTYFVGGASALVHNQVVCGDGGAGDGGDEAARIRALGTDPNSGQFRQAEADAAVRLEARVGTLTRDPTGDADWIDASGTTYDAVGPVPAGRVNTTSFNAAIDSHLLKQGLDVVVVDTTGMTSAEKAAVQAHISSLSPAQQAKIIVQ